MLKHPCIDDASSVGHLCRHCETKKPLDEFVRREGSCRVRWPGFSAQRPTDG